MSFAASGSGKALPFVTGFSLQHGVHRSSSPQKGRYFHSRKFSIPPCIRPEREYASNHRKRDLPVKEKADRPSTLGPETGPAETVRRLTGFWDAWGLRSGITSEGPWKVQAERPVAPVVLK